VFGAYVLSHTYEDLQIHDLEGALVGRWLPPEGQLEDVWLDGDNLYLAAGPHVHHVALTEIASAVRASAKKPAPSTHTRAKAPARSEAG
jgi:hypothetical protein